MEHLGQQIFQLSTVCLQLSNLMAETAHCLHTHSLPLHPPPTGSAGVLLLHLCEWQLNSVSHNVHTCEFDIRQSLTVPSALESGS